MALIWKERLIRILRWSEKYTKTDMVYFASGNFWLTVSRAASVATGLILTTALANLLPPATYGFLDYMIAAASMLSAFTITGLQSAVLNNTARGDDGVFRETTRRGVKWYLPSAAIALVVSIYYALKGDSQLGTSFFIIAACAPFGILGNYKSYLQGKRDFKMQTIYGIVRSAVPVAFLVSTATLTSNPIAIVAAYFVPGALTSVVIYLLVVRKYRIPKDSQNYDRAMEFAKHTSITGFLLQLGAQADQLFIWHFMGAEAVATYSIATSPVEELKNIPANILAVAAPRLAARKGMNTKKEIHEKIVRLLAIIAPIAVAYAIAAPFLFTTLFPKYVGAILFTQIYVIALFFQPQNLVDSALLAADDVKIRRRVIVTNQILKFAFLGIGIWLFGIWGGIGALILSDFTNSMLLLRALRKLH